MFSLSPVSYSSIPRRRFSDVECCFSGQRAQPQTRPAAIQKVIYPQGNNDTSGTYVQPQLLLSQSSINNHHHSQSSIANTGLPMTNKLPPALPTDGIPKPILSHSQPINAIPYQTPQTHIPNALIATSANYENHKSSKYSKQPATYEQLNFSSAGNVSISSNYIDDFNGSDYVCMTRGAPQTASKLTASLSPTSSPYTNIVTSSPASFGSPKHVSGTVTNAENRSGLSQQPPLPPPPNQSSLSGATANQHETLTSVSPTPSQLSSSSGSSKSPGQPNGVIIPNLYIEFQRRKPCCHTM